MNIHQKPLSQATHKSQNSDFVVREMMPIADNLSDQGEHLWLFIQKTGINTAHLAKLLALWANIPQKDVNYSGLKDRNAVTYQWFSLRLPKGFTGRVADGFNAFMTQNLPPNECATLAQHHYHHKKLGRGTHKGNQFSIILRDVVCPNQAILQNTLNDIATHGIPNYFGNQRFGKDNANITKTADFFERIINTPKPQHPLSKKSTRLNNDDAFLVSVAKSVLFNAILDKRVADNTWKIAISGDVFNLEGSNSLFCADIDEDIITRITKGDIHPTAPLFGIGGKISDKAAYALENEVLSRPELQIFTQGLSHLKIAMTRRPLRVIPRQLSHQWLDDTTLQLDFILPTGSFATAVLNWLVEDLVAG